MLKFQIKLEGNILEKIIILGSGAFAREAFDWITQSGHCVAGFFSGVKDDALSLRGVPIYYAVDEVPLDLKWIVGSGNQVAINAMVNLLKDKISPSRPIIHNSCILGSNVSIGNGSIICPGCIITCDVEIGENTVINISSTIGHDCKVGSSVHISPNSSLSGGTIIGDNCQIGTNCVTIPGVSIADNIIVGASTVITKHLIESGVYVGSPARKIK